MTEYSKKVPKFQLAVDFKCVLQDFTMNFLLHQPDDLVAFGKKYFEDLKGRSVVINNDGDHYLDIDDFKVQPVQERRKSIYGETYDPESEGEEVLDYFEKTEDQKKQLRECAKQIMVFQSVEDEQLEEIIDTMFEKRVRQGEFVITQGDEGDFFYIIESGIYEIFQKDANGDFKLLRVLNNKGSFGEIALLYNVPRTASVLAKTKGILWVVKRQTFRRIVVKNAFKRRKTHAKFIDKVPLFKELDSYEKLAVADALVRETYEDGDIIIRQGDAADGMFFVESGKVVVKIIDDSGLENVIRTLHSGAYFGELALINHQPRTASIYADGLVKLAYLDVQAFERLLGPCMEIMKRNLATYDNVLARTNSADITT